jgi:4-hydroxybenzoate polyprenyltransferase
MTPQLLETRAHKGWAVVRLTRPWFWPLGWGGAGLGSVLATGGWVPPAATRPASLAAFLVLGPLVWTAVLTVNDLHDLPSDRVNPRKATAPLVTGVLTAGDLTRWCWCSSVAAVVVAAVAGWAFAAGTVAVLVLGWLYSAPPVRLKGRPGADVAVNALVIGVFAPGAGWSLHRPAADYPPILALLGLLLVAALYLPTTVLDRDADVRAGDRTAAVRWRPESCYRAGLALWTAATALWLACCRLDMLVERDSWWFQTATAPVLIAVYAIAARRPSIPRMAVVAVAFAIPATDFLIAVVRAG